MRLRGQPLGTKNLIGARVESARKNQNMKQKELLAQLQVRGVDLNASGLSKLEGQIRYVTDMELLALSDILGVSVMWLLTGRGVKDRNEPVRAADTRPTP
jgi:transcriptional regulator with XRE-family HTH domain